MKKQLLFISVLTILGFSANAQTCAAGGCTSAAETNQYPTTTFSTTSSSWTTVSAYMNAGNWTLFNVTSGDIYEWTYCANFGGSQSWDAELTLFNNSTSATLCYANNCGLTGCSNSPYIRWTATFTGTVKLLTTVSGCITNTGSPYSTLVWRDVSGTASTTILGIDVSSYQGTINWSQVKAAGYSFAWAKATEGVTVTDAQYHNNATNGVTAGVKMGAYHFAHPESNSAAAEASHFLSVAQAYIIACQLPPCLDFETTGSLSGAQLTTWAEAWMLAVKNATGITPIIYTDGSIAGSLQSSITAYPLWMADPDGSSTAPPSSLGVWAPNWDFKQYSWTGTVPGISSGSVDLDVFHGNTNAFNTLIGCSTSVPPVASFTASTTTVCTGHAVTLTDNSTNTPTSWTWTMTNGTPATSTSQNPSVTYNTAGTYTVTLVAHNSSGASSPVSHTITVNVSPSVPTVTLAGDTLTSSASAGNHWYLNGVAISGATNQSYIATSSGSYKVVVTNSFGCSSTSTVTIYSNNNVPVANFTASTADCVGQAITLTDSSSNTPTSWSWTMTNGTPATSNLQSPSVTYSTAGTYTVTLVATNSSGTSAPVSQTITVGPAVPTINLSGNTLTSSSTTGNQWYLNGVAINGAINQTYSAIQSGVYTVVVTNSFGCSSTSATTSYSNGNAPVANFTASTKDCEGQAITLADSSTNTPTSWAWTMTSGTPASSSSQNPSVTYSTAGTYTVTLVATNASGASVPVSNTITVNANPPTPTITLAGITLTSSATTGNQWYWNSILINGATNQSCTAATNGLYTVVVTNSLGCISTSAAMDYSANGINSITDNIMLTIFPNPSNGIVTLNFAGISKHINIEVINDLGQLVYTEKINDCANDCNKIIDISSFKKGIYLFRIVTDENIYAKKILFVD